MKFTSKTGLVILILCLTLMVNVPFVSGASETQTISITNTNDDGFVTEIGYRFFDMPLISVLDPNMDIRSYLVFRDIKINYWEPLNNATLRVRTANVYDFEADSTFTIYGVKQKRFGGFGTGADVLSAPLTTAHVNFNASEFYGAQFWDFNVSSIVAELINNPYWDGDGIASTETGDNMGFVILGPEGFASRHFYDYSGGQGFEADLIIGWNQEPPPPGDGDFQYVKEHRGWEIWNYTARNPWLNFSTFTVYGPDSGTVSGLNDTYFHVNALRGDDQIWMQRNFTDDGTGIVNLKFGIEFTHLQAGGGPSYGWYGIWGLSDTNTTWIDSWGEGYAFMGRTYDLTPDAHRGTAYDIEANGLGDSGTWFYSVNFTADRMPYTLWYNITLNMNSAVYNVSTYNDMEMTDLNNSWNYAFTDTPPTYSQDAFPYETLVNGYMGGGQNIGYTGNYLSGFIDEAPELELYIIDPNGTVIPVPDEDGDGDIDEDDAEDLIERLTDDPEDPNPGGTWPDEGPFTRFGTRIYIFILGVGLFWGPLIYMASGRPTGYQFVIGAFIMLVGIAFLIAAGSV